MRGTDKLLEKVDGMPLLMRQTRIARAATTGKVLVALPPWPHPRYDVLHGMNITTVPVEDAADGMSATLRAGLAALPAETRCAMILLADLPGLQTEDLVQVADAVDLDSETQIWRGATTMGEPGHPIVFASALFPEIAKLSGDTGARDVVATAQSKVQLVPLKDNRARLDLDTPEDWEAWRAGRTRKVGDAPTLH